MLTLGTRLTHDTDVRPLDSLVQIRVLKYHKWALAASLEGDILHVDSSRAHDVAASSSASGESDLVNTLVASQNRSGGLAVAGHDVHNTCREAGFLDEGRKVKC
jgi:hypothetical protein